MLNDPTEICRVCGWPQEVAQHGSDGASPSFDFCDCCGVEFGYGDVTLVGIINHRQTWVKAGCPWQNPQAKPASWDLNEQLTNVKPQYMSTDVSVS